MKLLTKEKMLTLTTKRLLAYKNKLMKVPEGPGWDDEYTTNSGRLNKTHDIWKTTYHELKSILETRENVK